MPDRLPTYYISHGGGPWTHMEGDYARMHAPLRASLEDIPRQVGRAPRAILMVSGHWEDRAFAVMAGAQPPMLYDYGGFPPHTYTIRYDAPGDPALAARVHDLLAAAGLPTRLDESRGFDHGAFVPMFAMYPQADIPLLQLSLRIGLDPAEHIAAGRALAPLREEGVLIVGSGASFHNLRLMGPPSALPSQAFDAWLQETLGADPGTREQRLLHWEEAPAARIAHARDEHLTPLFVAVGAAHDEPAACVYHEDRAFGYATMSSFRFGAAGPT